METAPAAPENPSGGPLRAFILCGGLGTRLRSVLRDRPKSMAPVAGVPFLQILLERLRRQGIREIILGTGHRAAQIEQFFGNGEVFGLELHYSREERPLGTGGAVRLAANKLSDPAIVLNGDSYVEWDLARMRQTWERENADLVMALQAVPDVSRYGSVALGAGGRVLRFTEKGAQSGPGLINAGVYLLRREIVRRLAPNVAISLEKAVFPALLEGRVYGVVSEGLFIDIGVPEDLERAQTLFAPNTSG